MHTDSRQALPRCATNFVTDPRAENLKTTDIVQFPLFNQHSSRAQMSKIYRWLSGYLSARAPLQALPGQVLVELKEAARIQYPPFDKFRLMNHSLVHIYLSQALITVSFSSHCSRVSHCWCVHAFQCRRQTLRPLTNPQDQFDNENLMAPRRWLSVIASIGKRSKNTQLVYKQIYHAERLLSVPSPIQDSI